jgi:hypothetical protein
LCQGGNGNEGAFTFGGRADGDRPAPTSLLLTRLPGDRMGDRILAKTLENLLPREPADPNDEVEPVEPTSTATPGTNNASGTLSAGNGGTVTGEVNEPADGGTEGAVIVTKTVPWSPGMLIFKALGWGAGSK